jgi:hypothetical protein
LALDAHARSMMSAIIGGSSSLSSAASNIAEQVEEDDAEVADQPINFLHVYRHFTFQFCH